jgi:hypothetical protein
MAHMDKTIAAAIDSTLKQRKQTQAEAAREMAERFGLDFGNLKAQLSNWKRRDQIPYPVHLHVLQWWLDVDEDAMARLLYGTWQAKFGGAT